MTDVTKWIGVDLDGTLAHYEGTFSPIEIGKPIPKMVERVKQWLKEGKEVRIFTARVGTQKDDRIIPDVIKAIETWCEENIGQKLPITNLKDFGLIELWDDRAIQVIKNTGEQVIKSKVIPVDVILNNIQSKADHYLMQSKKLFNDIKTMETQAHEMQKIGNDLQDIISIFKQNVLTGDN